MYLFKTCLWLGQFPSPVFQGKIRGQSSFFQVFSVMAISQCWQLASNGSWKLDDDDDDFVYLFKHVLWLGLFPSPVDQGKTPVSGQSSLLRYS